MTLFSITLNGRAVFHQYLIFCLIKDTTDETLNRVKTEIEKKYDLKVYDFSFVHGILVAETDNPDIKVFLDEVEILE